LIESALTREKIRFRSLRGEIKDKDKGYEQYLSDPKIKVLVANPQCGGEGIDRLQNVCNTVIFYSNANTDSPILRLQAEGRIYRTGQTKKSLFIDLVLEGTTDEIVSGRVKQGKETLDEILQYFKNFKHWNVEREEQDIQ
jgi:ERCC4-related helicase